MFEMHTVQDNSSSKYAQNLLSMDKIPLNNQKQELYQMYDRLTNYFMYYDFELLSVDLIVDEIQQINFSFLYNLKDLFQSHIKLQNRISKLFTDFNKLKVIGRQMMAQNLQNKTIPDHGHIQIARLYLKRQLYFLYVTLSQYKIRYNKVMFTQIKNEEELFQDMLCQELNYYICEQNQDQVLKLMKQIIANIFGDKLKIKNYLMLIGCYLIQQINFTQLGQKILQFLFEQPILEQWDICYTPIYNLQFTILEATSTQIILRFLINVTLKSQKLTQVESIKHYYKILNSQYNLQGDINESFHSFQIQQLIDSSTAIKLIITHEFLRLQNKPLVSTKDKLHILQQLYDCLLSEDNFTKKTRITLNLIEMVQSLPFEISLESFNFLSQNLGIIISQNKFELAKQLNNFYHSISQQYQEIIINHSYPNQVQSLNVYLMVQSKSLYNTLLLCTEEVRIVNEDLMQALDYSCNHAKKFYKIYENTYIILKIVFDIQDCTFKEVCEVFMGNHTPFLGKASRSTIQSIFRQIWIIYRFSQLHGLVTLQRIFLMCLLIIVVENQDLLVNPILNGLLKKYILKKISKTLLDFSEREYIQKKFLFTEPKDLSKLSKFFFKQLNTLANTDEQLIRLEQKFIQHKSKKLTDCFKYMKLLRKQNIPNTKMIHYYEHFVNYYAIQVFKIIPGNKRTMKKIYESNDINQPECRQRELYSKYFFKNERFLLYKNLHQTIIELSKIYDDIGFYELNKKINLNFSIILLRLNQLDNYLTLNTYCLSIKTFQTTVDQISNLAEHVQGGSNTEYTRKSLYKKRRSVTLESIQSTMQKLMISFDQHNILKSSNMFPTFKRYLIQNLCHQRFGEQTLYQELISNNSDIFLAKQLIQEVQPYYNDQLDSTSVEKLISLSNPYEVDFNIEPIKIKKETLVLVRDLMALLVLGGCQQIVQHQYKKSTNSIKFIVNWISLLQAQQAQTLKDMKRFMYLQSKLTETLRKLIKHQPIFETFYDKDKLFNDLTLLSGKQVDSRFLIRDQQAPKWIYEIFLYQRKSPFEEYLDQTIHTKQNIVHSDDAKLVQDCRIIAQQFQKDIVTLYLLEENGESILFLSKYLHQLDTCVTYSLNAMNFKETLLQLYSSIQNNSELFKQKHQESENNSKYVFNLQAQAKRATQDRVMLRLLNNLDSELGFLSSLLSITIPLEVIKKINNLCHNQVQKVSVEFSYYIATCIINTQQPHSTFFEQDLFSLSCNTSQLNQLIEECLSIESLPLPQSVPILLLDPKLQLVPWEHLPSVERAKTCFNRILSLRHLVSIRPDRSASLYYVLNPAQDLRRTEQALKVEFAKIDDSMGLIATEPTFKDLMSQLVKEGIYFYAGHGAGQLYLNEQHIRYASKYVSMKKQIYLFGCSSAALIDIESLPHDQQEKEVELSRLEPCGVLLEYVLCGSPLVCGCLYLITDKDIDNYAKLLITNIEKEQKTNITSCIMQEKQYQINMYKTEAFNTNLQTAFLLLFMVWNDVEIIQLSIIIILFQSFY